MEYRSEIIEGMRLAHELGGVLAETPNVLDSGTPPGSEPERMLMQLVYQVNRQNYLSLLASIESDHVIPAAMLARSLLEESIRWNWMTDEPQRTTALFHSLRLSVRLITEECNRLGIDPAPFVTPSPMFGLPPVAPPPGSANIEFPGFEQMLRESESILRGSGTQWQVRDALYAQYRVLSQLAHTNVLGMIATVQPGSDADVSIGQRLSEPVAALVIHSASASVFVVASHTVHAFIDGGFEADQATDLLLRAMSIAAAVARLLSPIHQLTP